MDCLAVTQLATCGFVWTALESCVFFLVFFVVGKDAWLILIGPFFIVQNMIYTVISPWFWRHNCKNFADLYLSMHDKVTLPKRRLLKDLSLRHKVACVEDDFAADSRSSRMPSPSIVSLVFLKEPKFASKKPQVSCPNCQFLQRFSEVFSGRRLFFDSKAFRTSHGFVPKRIASYCVVANGVL